jgi:(1->4)-alpha-D-glucan 1-alpha-D-glucosylmutase
MCRRHGCSCWRENFGGEFEGLVRALHACAMGAPLGGRDLSPNALRRVLRAVLAAFRRYRSYGPEDAGAAAGALQAARAALAAPDHALLDELARWLQLSPGDGARKRRYPAGDARGAGALALRRFRQLTPPLAAKSVEDTAFYRYGPLLSRNEVGSFPDRPAPGADAFHEAMMRRARDMPRAMLATATHDHKRGEDTRARLAVLSELPELWSRTLRGWLADHAQLCTRISRPGLEALQAPSPADRIMLYQTLVGAWPPGLAAADREAVAAFAQRVAAWQQKALREAKLHSSWMLPQTAYEDACRGYLTALLQGEASHGFIGQLAALLEVLAPAARSNSLAQTLLRLSCPGVPDLYQGCELADFSLVDPDNRRPVDMAARRQGLASTWPPEQGWQADLWLHGKQVLIRQALALRRRHPAVFCGGDYLPLAVTGPAAATCWPSRGTQKEPRPSPPCCAIRRGLRSPPTMPAGRPHASNCPATCPARAGPTRWVARCMPRTWAASRSPRCSRRRPSRCCFFKRNTWSPKGIERRRHRHGSVLQKRNRHGINFAFLLWRKP